MVSGLIVRDKHARPRGRVRVGTPCGFRSRSIWAFLETRPGGFQIEIRVTNPNPNPNTDTEKEHAKLPTYTEIVPRSLCIDRRFYLALSRYCGTDFLLCQQRKLGVPPPRKRMVPGYLIT